MAQAGTAEEGMQEVLRSARLLEAAHRDAGLAIRDSKTLRLAVLKDELTAALATSDEARRLFDIALSPGDPPRLWLDLISMVVMEPDYRTYRLVQDSNAGREILFETTDRAEMTAQVKQLLAHRLIARERQIAGTEPMPRIAINNSTGSLVLAWLAGVMLGVLGMLSLAIYLKLI